MMAQPRIRGGVTAISGSLAETRITLARAIGEVEQQAAITNTKLDSLTDELKKHR
jgi:hypothetical protein